MTEARCLDCHVKIEVDKDTVKCESCGLTMQVFPGTPPTLRRIRAPTFGMVDDAGKPTDVSIAVALLYVSFGIGLVVTLLSQGVGTSTPSELIINVVVLLLSVLLTMMISQGRNWARKTFLVLFFLSLPLFLMALVVVSGVNVLAAIVAALPAALQGIAATLLLRSSSRDWFVDQSRPIGSIV